MGRLKRAHIIEAAIWLTIAAVFFGYSFEFNQPIEIYKFGATAWPRVVVAVLVIATLGNLYYSYRYGSSAQQGRIGVTNQEDETDFSDPSTLIKMIAVLFTPFIFAWLLKPVGIYFSAPFFIAAIMWLFGERRIKAILIMTAVIYVIFLGLFLVVLNAPLPQGNTSPFYDYSAWILKMNTQLQNLW
ncbi:tripartite tricarboxylate transporter TctB family protein [uncultured Tateyamaria sp.]|uniref:tripartite tricarboxylate transporter TctB family protein n=1 Tax=uncultured Tateyamaria sp. TaxID=455651 RepID=UPI00261F5DE1|nr:tripartite tricarboxylate transporter TctB family protein [uncultured Tateyamaria sp.]